MGEKELGTEENFSRLGRVNYMLERRLLLLEEVQKLNDSLGITVYPEFTCENAENLYNYHIESRWQEYEKFILKPLQNQMKEEKPATVHKQIALEFPFLRYLKICRFLQRNDRAMNQEDGDEDLTKEALAKEFFDYKDIEADAERAYFYWQIIHNIFKELQECRAFEILRNNKERGNYLVSKQAKIIAMTCTHAALKRKDLIDTGFEYDNVIIEEAGQILEIETFIPFVLQAPRFGKTSKLKRIILIGKDALNPQYINYS